MGRLQIVLDDEVEKRFRESLRKESKTKKGNISEEIQSLIELNFKKAKEELLKQDSSMNLDKSDLKQIEEFYEKIPTLEKKLGRGLILNEDTKTSAVYTECHISAKDLVEFMDLDAVVDPENQEEFRANRLLRDKDPGYLIMLDDAKKGRQFSDIVIEYNTEYKPKKPLKVLGGQHRSEAIKNALPLNRYHGIRVYFNLDKVKRVELYIVSNTNIQVPKDLIDRLNEQSMEPPNKLRDYCYAIGILQHGDDFGERRSSEEAFLPTVRMMRTFVVNFYKGMKFKGGDFDALPLIPYLCKSGTDDEEYTEIFHKIKSFKDDNVLLEAGKNFVKMHKKQFEQIGQGKIVGKKEFRIKALSLSVVSSWAFAAGLLQSRTRAKRLKKLYSLPDLSGDMDPLNAKAMSEARIEEDPETYRGLGTRSESKERGRMLKLFLLFSKSSKPKISLEMCKAAMQDFTAQDLLSRAHESKKKAFGAV
jgi:hypothetical protein